MRNVVTGESEQVECDGVFISVGRIPSTELVGGQLHLDPAGYIVAGETTETNIPGVYAVGDVRTKRLRQIISAAHMAEEYLADRV